VSAQPASDLSVHQLAARVGVSRRHFSRLCAEQVSTSPPRYVVQVRIESARQLLETDSLDPSNIASQPASQVGFGRPDTTRRTFQRRRGVTPDDYRRRFSSIRT
jgi:transcriptional regulator GlxA family with amidase domain